MDSLPLHPYDIVMLLILVGATFFGWVKGMAWQLASLASIVVSAFVAVQFSPTLAPLFGQQAPWNRFLAMLTLYLLTSVAIWLLFRLVAGAIDRVKLHEFDRQAGAGFGLLKGILLCLVLTFFAVTLSETLRQAVLRSRSGYYAAWITQHAAPVLPKEIRDVIGRYIDQMNRRLDPNAPAEPPAVDPAKTAGEIVGRAAGDEAGRVATEAMDRARGEGQAAAERLRSQAAERLRELLPKSPTGEPAK